MKRSLLIVVGILAIMALVGGAFWGGMNMGKAQAQNEQNSFFASRGFDPNNLPGGANGGALGQGGQGGQGVTGGAGGFFGAGGQGQGGIRGQRGATGTIEKIDGNAITLTTVQGETVTVNVADNTPILKTVQADKSDLKVGMHILAIGERSGNNVSATGVQITDRPAGMDTIFGGQGVLGGQGGRSGTPTPTK